MRRYLTGPRLFGGAAFVAALMLVFAAAVVVKLDEERLRSSFGWVQHTQRILMQVDRIDTCLALAVAAQRGYRLNGREDELAAFDQASSDLRNQIDALAPLVADDPVQARRLTVVRRLVEERLAMLASGIAVARAQRPRADSTSPERPPQQALLPIATELSQFRNTEVDLLTQRQQSAAQASVASNRVAIVTVVLALGTAVLGIMLLERQREHVRTRQLQAELFHVARLSTAGQTASMLSHELKQPLTAARNFLSAGLRMLGMENVPRERIVEVLQRSAEQVERAGDIIRHVRQFLHRSDPQRAVEPVGELISQAIVIAALERPDMSIAQRIAPDLPPVWVDKIQIQQVLVNLMRNGLEAMEGRPRKELVLSARLADAGMVEIAVRDTGSGLPKDVVARLFQPFVTTKSGGMGVGLSICHHIVEAHGGRIWADTELPSGTSFHFTVPIAATQNGARPVPAGTPA